MLKNLLVISLLFSSPLGAEELSPKLYLPEMEEPKLGDDSMEKEGVPKGKVTDFVFGESKVFPDTKHQVHVYVPAQYDAAKETPVMVFQDGHSYVNLKGEFRVTTVLDNLIAAKEIPPMIAIFIDPGHKGGSKPESPWKNNNRSLFQGRQRRVRRAGS